MGDSITLAQRLVVERDSRVADAVPMDARKKVGPAREPRTSPRPRPSATKQRPS